MSNRLTAALLAATMLIPAGAILAMAPIAGTPAEEAIVKLRAEMEELATKSQDILDAAETEGREVTAEEIETITGYTAKIENLKNQIDVRQKLVDAQAGAGRRTTPAPGGPGPVPATPKLHDAKAGFKSLGEFARTVKAAGRGQMDNRLLALDSNNDGTGSDGGFAVPPEWRRDIWAKVTSQESLLVRTDRLTTGSNALTVPKDESTPWDTTRGIQAYWESEAGQIENSKHAFETMTVRLAKCNALVKVTDELLEDAPGFESYVRSRVPLKFASKLNTAIISGTGVGQMLGILNSPSAITISKESSQAADTIYKENVQKMYQHLWAPCRANAVWLCNQDVEAMLENMVFDRASETKIPVYMPPGGVADSPYARLRGKPVIPVEACPTLGDKGDLIFADLTQYLTLTKGNDIKSDVSIHLDFDKGLTAFRFTLRINGQPWWGEQISPQNGTMKRSWATVIEARS